MPFTALIFMKLTVLYIYIYIYMTATVTVCVKLALTSWFVCEDPCLEFHEILTFGLVAYRRPHILSWYEVSHKIWRFWSDWKSWDDHVQNLKPSTLLQQTYCLFFITGCSWHWGNLQLMIPQYPGTSIIGFLVMRWRKFCFAVICQNISLHPIFLIWIAHRY